MALEVYRNRSRLTAVSSLKIVTSGVLMDKRY